MSNQTRAALWAWGALALLACASPLMAQATVQELYNDLPTSLIGAKATTLGGAMVGSASDNSTAWWNPAGNNTLEDFTVAAGNVTAVTGTVANLRNAYNVVAATDFGSLSQADYDRLLALGNASLTAGVVPAAFVNTGHIGNGSLNGFGLFAVGTAYLNVPVVTTDNVVGGQRIATITANGGALALIEYGLSYSKRVGTVDLGLSIKGIEGLYYGVGGEVTLTDSDLSDGFVVNDVTDTTVNVNPVPIPMPYGRGRTFGVDVGALWRTGERTQQGLVVRNANFPRLNFADQNGVVGQTLRIAPRVDYGLRTELDDHVAISADLHNVLFANGGGPSLHLGVDYRAFGSGYVRMGVNQGTPSLGLGFHISKLFIDTAVGVGDRTFATFGAHMSF